MCKCSIKLRNRPTLRAKCHVRLAWLIKRLLCRLIITSPDKNNVWNEKKLSPREAGPLGFSCKILLKTALLLTNNCVKYFCNKMPSLIVVKIGLILYPLNRNQLRKVVAWERKFWKRAECATFCSRTIVFSLESSHKFWIGVYRPEA